jgi:signal transduction histidine kinase
MNPSAPRVLVVEDDPDMLGFLAAILGRQYRVETAADGREGLDKACAIRPDLIVTDVMMPGLDGAELVGELRGRATLDATPIIVLTARAEDELRVRLLAEGAQDYVAKPFSADELLARARNLVAVKRTHEILQSELVSRLGDLEQLAREVADTKHELQQALHSVEVARDQAEKALQARTMFLRLVSHELTTPLQALRLNLESLERRSQGLSPSQMHKLESISRASGRLNEMIEALLEYVRLESGRMEVRREDVSLSAIAAAVIEDLAPQAQQKGLLVVLRATGPVPPAHTDPRLVRLILANLVGNAIKYTDVGGVEVAVDHDASGHRVRVSDTGPGIPLEKQGAIFEPFMQLEALAHKHTPGVGLGLTIARELARALGARITVASRVGSGSTFALVLPGPRG